MCLEKSVSHLPFRLLGLQLPIVCVFGDFISVVIALLVSEEDKRATTNVQNGLVFFFLFSFILLSSL